MGAKIYNSDLTKEIIDGAKLQLNEGNIPSEIAEKVIPVMEVNPNLLTRNNVIASRNATNTGTIYTIPTDRKFFLTGLFVSATSTAAGSNVMSVSVQPKGGVNTTIASIRLLNTAAIDAANDSAFLNFSGNPFELEPGSLITATAGGTISASLQCAYGYTQSNIRA